MDESPPPWRAFAAIAAGALALRITYIVACKRSQAVLGDAIYYSAQAEALADGRGFVHPYYGAPAADHPPLTALAMAPVAFVTDSITAQRLAMALIGVAAVVAIACLGHLVAGPRAGIVAGVIAAVYPNLWMNDAVIMADSLTALFVALFLIGVYRWRAEPIVGRAAAVGLLAGLGTLTRSELPILVGLVIVPALLVMRPLTARDRIRHLATMTATAALVLSTWVVPNLLRFDRPVALSTNDGLTLIGANCDNTYYNAIGFWDLGCAPPVPGDQSVQSEEYRRIAVDYMRDHLDRLPTVVVARVGRVWSLYRPMDMVWLNQGEGREKWASRLGIWTYWALLPAAAAGAWLLRRRGVPTWPLLAPFVAVTITAAAFYGITRFRVPAEVSIVVLAGVAISAIWEPRQSLRTGESATATPGPRPPA